jgi:hypothetical protein
LNGSTARAVPEFLKIHVQKNQEGSFDEQAKIYGRSFTRRYSYGWQYKYASRAEA